MNILASIKHTAIQLRFILLMVVYTLLLAGCATSNSTSAPTAVRTPTSAQQTTPSLQATLQPTSNPLDRPVTTTGCGQAASFKAGNSGNVTIASVPAEARGASTRLYRVHVPAGYQANQPLPVVLVFHGHGGDAAGMEGSTGFSQLGDKQHFIAVYPQGLLDGENSASEGVPFWASIGPYDFGIDDIHYVNMVLDDLQQKLCVDNHRIYATGFSNGGGMSGFLACRLAGRIAAFAPLSGNFYALDGGCHPARPAAILVVHGTADSVVPYTGVSASVNPQWPLPTIPQWAQEWATRDGCTSGPTTFLQAGNVTGMQWTNCQGNTTVIHYRIDGGGHSWPQTLGSHSGSETLWLFFQAHPLP